MNALWQNGPGTVQQVLDWLPETLAYNSVLTTVRILEKKGYVGHLKDGRAHIYQPLINQREATRSEIRHLVGRFFKNSHEALLLNILRDEEISEQEVKRLREMLQASEHSISTSDFSSNNFSSNNNEDLSE